MYKNLVNHGTNYQPQLVQDFSHQLSILGSTYQPASPRQGMLHLGGAQYLTAKMGTQLVKLLFFFWMLAYKVGLFVGRLSLYIFCWGKGWGGWGWLGLRVYQFEMSFGTHEFCQRSRVPMGCTTPSTGL